MTWYHNFRTNFQKRSTWLLLIPMSTMQLRPPPTLHFNKSKMLSRIAFAWVSHRHGWFSHNWAAIWVDFLFYMLLANLPISNIVLCPSCPCTTWTPTIRVSICWAVPIVSMRSHPYPSLAVTSPPILPVAINDPLPVVTSSAHPTRPVPRPMHAADKRRIIFKFLTSYEQL